jgi:hypothetical protein
VRLLLVDILVDAGARKRAIEAVSEMDSAREETAAAHEEPDAPQRVATTPLLVRS